MALGKVSTCAPLSNNSTIAYKFIFLVENFVVNLKAINIIMYLTLCHFFIHFLARRGNGHYLKLAVL